MGRYREIEREIEGDRGRYREIQGDIGRYREIQGDTGRYGSRLSAAPSPRPQSASRSMARPAPNWLKACASGAEHAGRSREI